MKNTEKC